MKGNLAYPFVPTDFRKGVKVNFTDAYEWRWLCDKPPRWHLSWIIDFECDGKRIVAIKCDVILPYGVMNDRCDDGLEELKKRFYATKEIFSEHDPSKEVNDVEIATMYIPPFVDLRTSPDPNEDDAYYKQLWSAERTHKETDAVVSGSETITIERRKPYEQLRLF